MVFLWWIYIQLIAGTEQWPLKMYELCWRNKQYFIYQILWPRCWRLMTLLILVIRCMSEALYIYVCTVFVPLAAQVAYQSHFRWTLVKTLISRFFSLKLVIFEKKKSGKISRNVIVNPEVMIHKMVRQGGNMTHMYFPKLLSGVLLQFWWKRNYFQGLTDGRNIP